MTDSLKMPLTPKKLWSFFNSNLKLFLLYLECLFNKSMEKIIIYLPTHLKNYESDDSKHIFKDGLIMDIYGILTFLVNNFTARFLLLHYKTLM